MKKSWMLELDLLGIVARIFRIILVKDKLVD